MKKSCVLLSGLLLALNVAGCAGSNRALGEQTPDLVVYNDHGGWQPSGAGRILRV